MKSKLLTIVLVGLCMICLTACASKEVRSVIKKIDNIGEIGESTGARLEEINQEYSELSIDEKEKVKNYELYEKAVNDYHSYLRVNEVISLIDSIGEISKDTYSLLNEISSKYNALNDLERKSVVNFEEYRIAQNELDDYLQATVDEAVADLSWYEYEERNMMTSDLLAYYDYMSDEQKKECLALCILRSLTASFTE